MHTNQMFGISEEALRVGVLRMMANLNGTNNEKLARIAQMKLSDAQEIMNFGNTNMARQLMNQAKWVLDQIT